MVNIGDIGTVHSHICLVCIHMGILGQYVCYHVNITSLYFSFRSNYPTMDTITVFSDICTLRTRSVRSFGSFDLGDINVLAKALDLYETTFFTFAHIYNFSSISSTPDTTLTLSLPHLHTHIVHIPIDHGAVYSRNVSSSQSNSCSHFRLSRIDRTW